MRGITLFAAFSVLMAARATIAPTRNAVRIGRLMVAPSAPCLALDAEDDEDAAPGPQGTLPDDQQEPPSTEPSSPDDDLPSEPAAAHAPRGEPAVPVAL